VLEESREGVKGPRQPRTYRQPEGAEDEGSPELETGLGTGFGWSCRLPGAVSNSQQLL